MPRSVISSPIHISTIAPAVRVAIWVSVSKLDRSNVPGQDALRVEQGEHAVGLQDRHRDGQVAGVLVDLVAPELTLAAERLERRHDARHQLHDDRGVDVRVHPQGHDREVATGRRPRRGRAARPAALPSTNCCSCSLSTPGIGTDGEQPEDDQQAEDIEDPAPDIGRAEGVEEGFEHGSGVVAGGRLGLVGRGRLVVGRRRSRGSSASPASAAAGLGGVSGSAVAVVVGGRRSPSAASAALAAAFAALARLGAPRRLGGGLCGGFARAASASASVGVASAGFAVAASAGVGLGRHAERRRAAWSGPRGR